MNSKIIELAEEAGGFVDLKNHIKAEDGCVVYTYTGMQKFSELIVKECCRVIISGGYWDSSGLGTVIQCSPPEIARMIEEHFGIS